MCSLKNSYSYQNLDEKKSLNKIIKQLKISIKRLFYLIIMMLLVFLFSAYYMLDYIDKPLEIDITNEERLNIPISVNAFSTSYLEVGPGKTYQTIQDAINAANPGDIIIVQPNNTSPYQEHLKIDKSLTLLANTTSGEVIIFGGILISEGTWNVIIKNFSIKAVDNYAEASCVYIVGSFNILLKNNNFTGWEHGPTLGFNTRGIYIYRSSNISLSNNKIFNCSMGIYIASSIDCTLHNNTINECDVGLEIFADEYSGYGLSGYRHVIDVTNKINGQPVLYVYNASNTRIADINVGHVSITMSNNVTIVNCTLTKGDCFNIKYSQDIKVINSTISNCENGFSIIESERISLINNRIVNSGRSIWLFQSSYCFLRNNTIVNPTRGLYISSSRYLEHYSHDIDASNLIDGKPIYYLFNIFDTKISELDTKHLTIVYSQNVTVENITIMNGDPIQVFYSVDISLSNNTIVNCWTGIRVSDAGNIRIFNNKVFNCTTGIALNSARGEKIQFVVSNNTIVNPKTGIAYSNSWGRISEIKQNCIIMNDSDTDYIGIYIGINLYGAGNTIIKDNKIIGNYKIGDFPKIGIRVYGSSNTSIIGCNIIGCSKAIDMQSGVGVNLVLVESLNEEGYVTVDVSLNFMSTPTGGLMAYKIYLLTSEEIIVLDTMGGEEPFSAPPTVDKIDGQLIIAGSTTGSQGPQISELIVARLRLRLNSSVLDELVVEPSSLKVVEASSETERSTVLSADTLRFMRGDANGDGHISIADAMFIAQYLAGNRPSSDLNLLNAASVKHDGSEGDKISIADAMFIAQYLAGLRDEHLNLKEEI